MAGATVFLYSISSSSGIYLSNGGSATAWTGSGTPWTTTTTTPFELGMNDATGERFMLIPPPRTPIISGSPPFTAWGQTIGLMHTNRQIVIPIQLRATTQANLVGLLGIVRRALFDSLMRSGLYLCVIYNGAQVDLLVESGQIQEGPQFWNEEQDRGVMRAMLTLDCRIGVGESTTVLSAATITNAVVNTAGMASVEGDWRFFGQPLLLELSSGDIAVAGTKTVYAATTQATADSGVLAESLATTNTTGVTSTGSVSLSQSAVRRAVRYRCIVQITSPSSILQVRALVTYDSSAGQTIFTGEWVTPGTSTIVLDLGYLTPGVQASGVGLFLRLQYRSTTGGATSGTLARLRLLAYYTFCKIVPPNSTASNDKMLVSSAMPGNQTENREEAPARALVFDSTGADLKQQAAVAGQLPVAIEGAGLWLAWTTGGVFDSADTITVTADQWPLYETVNT